MSHMPEGILEKGSVPDQVSSEAVKCFNSLYHWCECAVGGGGGGLKAILLLYSALERIFLKLKTG